MRPWRFVAAVVVGLALVVACAMPANAQKKPMSFEGLDVGEDEAPPPPKKEPQKAPLPEAPPPAPAPAPAPAPGFGFGAEEKKPAFRGAISFEAIDVTLSSPDKEKMDAAIAQMKQGAFAQASITFYDILQNPKNLEFHQAAEYNLAKCLFRMGKHHSSLLYFIQILNKGQAHRFFQSSLEWLFFISRKVTNETTILDTVAKLAQFEFPPKYRDEFHFLLAKFFFLRHNNDEARKFITRIAETSPFYPKAKFIEGLAYFKENKFEDALNAFRDLAKVLHPKRGQFRDDDLREEAFLQLARIHYQAQQFKNSIYYFNKIDRDSENWLESLYESAWAYFRIDEQEKALGNLVTLHSPFFKNEYFPETLIIKAVIYYDNCRYPEANQFVAEFLERYSPLLDEIGKLVTQKMPPDKYYEYLSNIQKAEGGADDVKARVLSSALHDPDIKKLNDSIRELEKEMASFAKTADFWRFSKLAKKLADEVTMQKRTLASQAGALVKSRLLRERDELKELMAQSFRIQLEISTAEKLVLEAKLRHEELGAVLLNKRHTCAVADQEQCWPYEDEYWRDELGTYHYTMTKGCKPGTR
ncbi:MAG: adventurous gliding motility protein GltC [Deltaproteobacteria bacterium]|nr:adventurous gliding motility protein GltC [Deltaproteobacteria bacterium]